jgi:hypothetical protein
MVSILDILSGAAPLIVDVRQTGSGPDGAAETEVGRSRSSPLRVPSPESQTPDDLSGGPLLAGCLRPTPRTTGEGEQRPLDLLTVDALGKPEGTDLYRAYERVRSFRTDAPDVR